MRKFILGFILFFAGICLGDSLILPTVFSDHMVLQQGKTLPVWGTSTPGAGVTVEFAGQTQSTVTSADGTWRVDLAPLPASATPRTMTVRSGDQRLAVQDILVGEVWLCSGQSNMAWPMERTEDAEAAIAAADFPQIRLYHTPTAFTPKPKEMIPSVWKICSPDTVKTFSGTAYYFGKKLHEDLKVPVGLILSALGGTGIDPWTAPDGYEGLDRLQEEYQQTQTLPDPLPPGRDTRQIPSVLFNGMIAAHIPYAIQGAIWYQGEHDHREWNLYVDKTRALLNGWRKLWGYEFPFYLVQIAPKNYPDDDLSLFWEAQAQIVREIPKTGMAVISDSATLDNVHPPCKVVPGSRLALLAEANTYGMNVVSTGPVFQTLGKLDGKLNVTFSSADGLTTRDGKTPDWFELVGKDGSFKPADAEIEGNRVILSSPEIREPVGVRFAWSKLAKPNLMNAAGLPAWPFRAGELPEDSGTPAAALVPAAGAAPAAPSAKVITAAPSPAELPEMNGFRMVYQLNIPENATYVSAPNYDVDNSASDRKPFTKVAYLLELQKAGEEVRYAFVSMDRFTDDLKKIGLPVASSNARFMQLVTNLTVRSNVEGIVSCTDSDGGNIEFFPGNYGGPNTEKIPGASSSKHDFGDAPSDKIPGYGCMQVHNWKEKQTVFAINHWGMRGPVDIGIGNSPASGKALDWTFSANASDYILRRLSVFVK
jgi:sialate O-acetylesterase